MQEASSKEKFFEENPAETRQNNTEYIISQYASICHLANIQHVHMDTETIKAKLNSDIEFDENQEFVQPLRIKIMAHTLNYELMEIEAKIGHFTFKKITIASFLQESPTHKISLHTSGGFCSVFFGICHCNYLAFKCFSFAEQSNKSIIFVRTIHQYCLFKLASLLKMGPFVKNFLGVDLLIYENCIEFPMQMGDALDHVEDIENLEQDLIKNITLMHGLQMVHMDIKPENICFSPHFKKFVFIDFGFSRLIPEKISELTRSRFVGSLKYCSTQMQQAYFTSESRLIDLYYNDAHCIKQTIAQLDINRLVCSNQDKMYEITDVTDNYLLILLKYLLFTLQIPSFVTQIEKNKFYNIKRYSSRLISFIRQLNYSILFDDIEFLLNNYQQSWDIENNFRFKRQNLFTKIESKHHEEADEEKLRHRSKFLTLKAIEQLEGLFDEFQIYIIKNEDDILLKEDVMKQLKKQLYVNKLGAAIQINTDQFSISKRNQFCKVFISIYPTSSHIQSKCENIEQFRQLCQVSLTLFDYSNELPITAEKYELYQCILLNVIILELFNQDQLASYYQKIFLFNLNFQKKMRLLLKFYSTLYWIQFRHHKRHDFEQIRDILCQINTSEWKNISKNNIASQEEKQIFQMIFFKINIDQSLFFRNQIRKNLVRFNAISDKLSNNFFCQIQAWFAYFLLYMHHKQQQNASSWLQKGIYRGSYANTFQLEYYHLMLADRYHSCHLNYKLKALISKFNQVFEGSKFKDTFYLSIYDKILELKKDDPTNLAQLIEYIASDQLFIKNMKVNYFLVSEFLEIQEYKSYQLLPKYVTDKLFNSTIFYQYKLFENRPNSLFEHIYGNIYTMVRESSFRGKDARAQLTVKFKKIFRAQQELINKVKCRHCQINSLISLNLMLAYLLSFIGFGEQAVNICRSLTTLISKVEYLRQLHFEFYLKIILVYMLICQAHPRFNERKNSYQLYYEYHKSYRTFHTYFQYPFIIARTFRFFMRNNNLTEITYYINAITQHLSDFISNNNIDVFSRNFQRLCRQSQFQANQVLRTVTAIQSGLEDVLRNPYVGLFLSLVVENTSSPIHKSIFIKICRSLNYLRSYTRSSIQKSLYLRFYQSNAKISSRKQSNLLKKHMQQNINQCTLFSMLKKKTQSKYRKILNEPRHQLMHGSIKSCLLKYIDNQKGQ